MSWPPRSAAGWKRLDDMAQLVSDGLTVTEAGRYLGLSKGQIARAWADIKHGLGAQAA